MMSEKAQKIKDAFDRQKEIKAHNTSTEDFIEELQSDMLKTLREKYPYIEFAELPNKLKDTERRMLEERRVKGYAFDSLVYRYRIAREAQGRADAENDLRSGKTDQRADAYRRHQERADRDLMAFIKVLDDVIGEHD